MEKEKVILWKGQELSTMEDVYKAAISCKDKFEAETFLMVMAQAGSPRKRTLDNLGYYAGYYSYEDRMKIYELFGAVHPVFGMKNPTTSEAFQMGIEWAKKIKDSK